MEMKRSRYGWPAPDGFSGTFKTLWLVNPQERGLIIMAALPCLLITAFVHVLSFLYREPGVYLVRRLIYERHGPKWLVVWLGRIFRA